MRASIVASALVALATFVPAVRTRQLSSPPGYDVRTFGAKGDGRAIDSEAINSAIVAAAAAGGGIVDLPAGHYLSFSIRLKSHVTLRFGPGAVLIAADPASGLGQYDLPEPNPSDQYQDFGHSHWQNSLISGIDVDDVAIVGPGLIDGRGLTRAGPGAPWVKGTGGGRPLSMGAAVGGPGDPETRAAAHGRPGQQGDRAEASAERHAARFLDPERRPLRPARHRRRQPHHRRPEGRHESRRVRHRLLPQRADLERDRQRAERRRDRVEELVRAGRGPRDRERHDHELPRLGL